MKVFSFFVLFLIATDVLPQDQVSLRSAVSESYKEGLQFQFLKRISDDIGVNLDVVYAPFSRRLHMLKHGQLDIMVGLSYKKDRFKHIYYIKPPYYSNPINIFVLKGSSKDINKVNKLYTRNIGVSRHSKHFPEIDNSPNRVEAASIEQLVKMLLAKRIDGFIYNKYGGLKKLAAMNVSGKIISRDLNPAVNNYIYIGVSKKSEYYRSKDGLIVIKKTQEKYREIREKYYSDG